MATILKVHYLPEGTFKTLCGNSKTHSTTQDTLQVTCLRCSSILAAKNAQQADEPISTTATIPTAPAVTESIQSTQSSEQADPVEPTSATIPSPEPIIFDCNRPRNAARVIRSLSSGTIATLINPCSSAIVTYDIVEAAVEKWVAWVESLPTEKACWGSWQTCWEEYQESKRSKPIAAPTMPLGEPKRVEATITPASPLDAVEGTPEPTEGKPTCIVCGKVMTCEMPTGVCSARCLDGKHVGERFSGKMENMPTEGLTPARYDARMITEVDDGSGQNSTISSKEPIDDNSTPSHARQPRSQRASLPSSHSSADEGRTDRVTRARLQERHLANVLRHNQRWTEQPRPQRLSNRRAGRIDSLRLRRF